MKCKAKEYTRPFGDIIHREFNLPDEYRAKYESMIEAGAWFCAEYIPATDMVSIGIENSKVDIDMKLVRNDGQLLEGFKKLLDNEQWMKKEYDHE